MAPAPAPVPPAYQPPPYTMPQYPQPYPPQPVYAPPPPVAPVYPGYAYPQYAYGYAAMEHQKRVDRTKLGTLFLFIGFLLTWVPIAGAIAVLLFLIGAILVILGRRAFGDRHALYVVLSVVIYIVGIVVGVVAGAVAALQLFAAAQAGDSAGAAAALRTLITWGLVAAAISAIAYVLFVHELENPTGRYLLYAGYAATVAVNGVIIVLISSALSGATLGDIVALQDQLTILGLLNGVPSFLFAGAYYIAYSRIQRKEIPAAPAPGGPAPTAPMVPPYMPPTAAPAPPAPEAAPPSPPEGPPP